MILGLLQLALESLELLNDAGELGLLALEALQGDLVLLVRCSCLCFLRPDNLENPVVLVQGQNPLTEALRSNGSFLCTLRLELWVCHELLPDLLHDSLGNMIFVILQQLIHEVPLAHELLGRCPPVLFELLRPVLLWSPLGFPLEHDADGVQDLLDRGGRLQERRDLLNVLALYGVQGFLRLLQDRESGVKLRLTLILDRLSLLGQDVGRILFLLHQGLSWLHHFD